MFHLHTDKNIFRNFYSAGSRFISQATEQRLQCLSNQLAGGGEAPIINPTCITQVALLQEQNSIVNLT